MYSQGYGGAAYLPCSPAATYGGLAYGGLESRTYQSAAALAAEYSGFPPVLDFQPIQQHLPYITLSAAYDQPRYRQEAGRPNSRTSVTYIPQTVFLKPGRPRSQFVDSAARIQDFVVEAFRQTAGHDFPDDIIIRVCSAAKMRSFKGDWHPGILGFAINRLGFGVSEIFLLENELDVLMLTAGHEIGHVITFPAGNKIDEEAKAFAFEAAWMKAICQQNIAGLGKSINFGAFSPAQNGIHDAAFNFLRRQLFLGWAPLELFRGISERRVSATA